MKRRILSLALAVSMVWANTAFAAPPTEDIGLDLGVVTNLGTNISAVKAQGTPYTNEERTLTADKTKVSDDTSLPSGWEWKTPDQELTNEFADTTAVYKENGIVKNEVTVKIKKETDSIVPTGEISVDDNKFNSFLNTVTFGKLFKETKKITIDAADGESGVDKVEYYVSNTALSLDDVKAITSWTEYKDPFDLAPTNLYVVYVKITDKGGNTTYISTNGLIFSTSPEGYAKDITETSAKLGATFDENVIKAAKEIGFEYVKLGDDGFTKVKADVQKDVLVEVTGLQDNTDYIFRTYVVYEDGTEDNGAAGYFATLEKLPVSKDVKANKAEDNGILFTAGIDTLKYKEVGFYFEADCTEVKRGTNTVYSSIAGSDYTLADFEGAGYLYSFTIGDITDETKQIKVTPYSTSLSGVEVRGETAVYALNRMSDGAEIVPMSVESESYSTAGDDVISGGALDVNTEETSETAEENVDENIDKEEAVLPDTEIAESEVLE